MTNEELEKYADEFRDLPAYSRKKKCYHFSTYAESREAGFSYENIRKWIIE